MPKMEVRVERLGGRLTGLTAAGREWLLPTPPRSEPVGSASFVASPPGGWDEMAPTIVECEVDGELYPDHGDAWRGQWHESEEGELTYRSRFGYSLRRRHQTQGDMLHLDYLLEAEKTRPVLWAAHPLVAAPLGTTVELDYAGQVIDITEPEKRVPWVPDLGAIDTVQAGTYRKLVLDPDARLGEARIVHPDGAWLEFSWDVGAVPYLAVYLENRAFSERPCVALEPMTGWYDSLGEAVANGKVAVVGPESALAWHMSVRARGPR